MATEIRSGRDVIAFLEEQHQEIRTRFEEVLALEGDGRQSAFMELRRLLAVHETAEEEIIHPAARSNLPDGEAIVAARLQEENEAKHVLSQLEGMEVDSALFEARFRQLKDAVLRHAQLEEEKEFGPLGDQLDDERLNRMRDAVQFAERVAPTRPHAGVESRAANLLVGPFAAMIDRTRDAISGHH
jgi:hemerythrin superfamily protein